MGIESFSLRHYSLFDPSDRLIYLEFAPLISHC